MEMKKIFVLLFSVASVITLPAQHYTLQDILGGSLLPRNKTNESSADGMHYYQANFENTAVIKFSYATGKAVDTLFNTRKARDAPLIRSDLVAPMKIRCWCIAIGNRFIGILLKLRIIIMTCAATWCANLPITKASRWFLFFLPTARCWLTYATTIFGW